MKVKGLLLVSMVIVLSQTCAQKTEVPPVVKLAFSQKYPDISKVKWDKENKSEWEAEFKMNGEEYSALFDSTGNWKETEHELKKSDIPAAVTQTLEKEFAGYKIEEVELCETADGKVFEIALEKDEVDLDVTISPEGKVVKQEVKKEEDEDKDDDND